MVTAKVPLGRTGITVDFHINVYPHNISLTPRHNGAEQEMILELEPLDRIRLANELIGSVDAMSLFSNPTTRSDAVAQFRQTQILASVLGGPQGRKS